MTELEQIAASVARALGLQLNATSHFWIGVGDKEILRVDGSDLFDDHWRCRCFDWLHSSGWDVCIAEHNHHHTAHKTEGNCWITCPAAEFPARAIHELIRKT